MQLVKILNNEINKGAHHRFRTNLVYDSYIFLYMYSHFRYIRGFTNFRILVVSSNNIFLNFNTLFKYKLLQIMFENTFYINYKLLTITALFLFNKSRFLLFKLFLFGLIKLCLHSTRVQILSMKLYKKLIEIYTILFISHELQLRIC